MCDPELYPKPWKGKRRKKETQEKEKKRERMLVINLCLKEAITKISSSYKVESKRHALSYVTA